MYTTLFRHKVTNHPQIKGGKLHSLACGSNLITSEQSRGNFITWLSIQPLTLILFHATCLVMPCCNYSLFSGLTYIKTATTLRSA